jgi:hypothetical protein
MRVDAGLDGHDDSFDDRRETSRFERLDYSFKYSRSLLVWVRLTGISVPFVSFIRRI